MKKARNATVNTLLVIDVAIDAYVMVATWLLIAVAQLCYIAARHAWRDPLATSAIGLSIALAMLIPQAHYCNGPFWGAVGAVIGLLALGVIASAIWANKPKNNRAFERIQAEAELELLSR